MQRRRYVATQEESAPGPDGSTVCIVYQRLLRVPLPHVHRFSTVWVTCTEDLSSRGAHVACTVACMLVFKF